MSHRLIDIHTHQPHPAILSPVMAGVHPWDAEKGLALPDFSTCDIVGETGLDYASKVDRMAQERLFRQQLDIAQQIDRPVVLHVVRSFEDVMRILAEYPKLKGVLFHGFIGSIEQAARCFARGYYLSFGKRSLASPKSRQVIATAPAERIFCESDDAPSTDVENIYYEVAMLRGISIESLRQQITKNYEKLILER